MVPLFFIISPIVQELEQTARQLEDAQHTACERERVCVCVKERERESVCV